MKIIKLKILHLQIPLRKGYKLSNEEFKNTEPIIVKLYSDEGIVGFGETDTMAHFTEETPEIIKTAIKTHLGPVIIGMDPQNIAVIHEVMDKTIKGNSLAKAAIDMACYDIFGKVCDRPVHKLLGGRLRDRIPVMWSLGDNTPEANAEEAVQKKNAGYLTIMIKVGSHDIKHDVQRVRAVREAVGDDVILILDANQGWNAVSAIKFAKQVEKYGIEFFEQPVPYWDINGMAKVKKSVNIPISADESLFTIHDAVRLVQSEAADIFSIKVAKNGGIYKAKEIISYANACGIPCLMNSMLEEGITQAASLQLGLTAANLYECGHAYFSPLRLEDDISDFSANISRGNVKASSMPGLGIDVKEDLLEKYTVDSFSVTK